MSNDSRRKAQARVVFAALNVMLFQACSTPEVRHHPYSECEVWQEGDRGPVAVFANCESPRVAIEWCDNEPTNKPRFSRVVTTYTDGTRSYGEWLAAPVVYARSTGVFRVQDLVRGTDGTTPERAPRIVDPGGQGPIGPIQTGLHWRAEGVPHCYLELILTSQDSRYVGLPDHWCDGLRPDL